jgi:hypothetical protein
VATASPAPSFEKQDPVFYFVSLRTIMLTAALAGITLAMIAIQMWRHPRVFDVFSMSTGDVRSPDDLSVNVAGQSLVRLGSVKRLLLGALVSVTVANSVHQAAVPPSYEVLGTIREEFPNDRLPPVTRSFLCRVDGRRWHIELMTTSASTPREVKIGTNIMGFIKPAADAEVASSDGTNFYIVSTTDFSEVAGAMPPRAGALTVNASAVIGPGTVPFGWGAPFHVIWYAFGSFDYLQEVPGGMIFPMHRVTFEDARAGEHLVPARWELFTTPPYLPRLIQTSNYFNFTSMQNEHALKGRTFQNTNVDFQVLAVTNHHGNTIPTHVDVNTFFHRLEGDSSKAVRSRRFEVLVQSIDELREPIGGRPSLNGIAKVDDLRYWLSDTPAHVSIIASNGWPPDEVVEAHYRRRIAYENKGRGNKNLFGVIALAIIVGPPLVVWWMNRRPKQTHKHTQRRSI